MPFGPKVRACCRRDSTCLREHPPPVSVARKKRITARSSLLTDLRGARWRTINALSRVPCWSNSDMYAAMEGRLSTRPTSPWSTPSSSHPTSPWSCCGAPLCPALLRQCISCLARLLLLSYETPHLAHANTGTAPVQRRRCCARPLSVSRSRPHKAHGNSPGMRAPSRRY